MDAVEEIKERISIEDLVEKYVDLKRSGASYKGLCPFHTEKTPSFYVTPARGSYHCFGCGKGGDIFSFVMELDRLSFPDALKNLADQAGVSLPDRDTSRPSLSKRLVEANTAALSFFRGILNGEQGVRAREYLQKRQFPADTWDAFDLGFAPEGRDTLVRNLRAGGFDDRTLLAAGLAVQDDTSGQTRDRFRLRLIFPIKDRSGRVVGFGGRTLGDGQPKYLNSPQTEIFDKSAVLFGIHRAQEHIRTAQSAVLVEGYLDAVRAHAAGYGNVVASLGTAVTTRQLSTLAKMTDTVVLALDPDPAGQAAAARTSLTALAEVRASEKSGSRLELRVALLPEAHGDPDDLIRDHPDLWPPTIAQAIPAFEFYFEQTLRGLDRTQDAWRQEAIDHLLPVIQQFATSAGWQAIWIERLSRATGVDPRALQRSLPSANPARRRQRGPSKQEQGKNVVQGTTSRALASEPAEGIERALLALLLQIVVIPDEAAGMVENTEISTPEHRVIFDALLRWRERENYDFEMFMETVPEDVRAVATELHDMAVPLPGDGSISVAVAYHIARLRHFRVQNQLEILQGLGDEDRSQTFSRLASLMQQRQEVEQTLDRLSKQAIQSGLAFHPLTAR